MTKVRTIARTAVRSTEARVIFASGLGAGAATVFALVTARWLGPSNRGTIVVFMTTSSFLMLVGSFGVSTGARVLLNGSPPLSLKKYVSQARILSVVHLVTSSTVGLFVLAKSGGLSTLWVGVIFVPFASIQLYSYLQREALHGVGRHGNALYGDVLASLLQTGAVLALEMAGRFSLVAVCLVVLAGAMAQTIFLAACLRSVEQRPPYASYSPIGLVRYSLPAMVTTLGQAFVIRGDRLILGMLAGAAPVGVYGAAATFTEILWLVPGAVAQVAFRKASVNGANRATARVRNVVLLVTVLGAIVLAACTRVIVTNLLGSAYSGAVGLAYILIAASLPMTSFQLDLAVLNGLGRLADGGRTTMLGTAALLIGCLASIPTYGAYGAAWSSIVAYLVMAVRARVYVRRAEGRQAFIGGNDE